MEQVNQHPTTDSTRLRLQPYAEVSEPVPTNLVAAAALLVRWMLETIEPAEQLPQGSDDVA